MLREFLGDRRIRLGCLPREDQMVIFQRRGKDDRRVLEARAGLELGERINRLISSSLIASRREESSRRNWSTAARR